LNADALLDKATRAARVARSAIDDGNFDDATSRAYYAMFNAARAALELVATPLDLSNVARHGTILTAFGLHLIKAGHLDRELGSALTTASVLRKGADYGDRPVSAEAAIAVTGDAENFVACVRDLAEKLAREPKQEK
jgi:uncharacterized protein (UPF0332 family)